MGRRICGEAELAAVTPGPSPEARHGCFVVPATLGAPDAKLNTAMNPFNRLPGFTRSAPGLERRLLRRMPALLAWGTLVPLLAVLAWHAFASPADSARAAHDLGWLDYTLAGVVLLHWTLCLTLGLGCFIVMVMKGPAYVADPYPPAGRENPLDMAQGPGPRP